REDQEDRIAPRVNLLGRSRWRALCAARVGAGAGAVGIGDAHVVVTIRGVVGVIIGGVRVDGVHGISPLTVWCPVRHSAVLIDDRYIDKQYVYRLSIISQGLRRGSLR